MKNNTVSGEQSPSHLQVKKLVTAVGLVSATVTGMQAMPAFSAQLEEVMVTATRRTETNIQTTPIAITALTSSDIEELVPRDLGDISAQVPNFSAGKQPGFKAAAFAIRGVGTTSIIVYQDAQVGVTVDDFVLPSVQTQNMEMFDIEQIEVLRGPQGTLFGKNTTGGVINVKTKRPRLNETTIELQGKVEEYGRYEGRFAGNYGTDTLAFRAAGAYIKSDGFYENGASYGPVAPFDPARKNSAGSRPAGIGALRLGRSWRAGHQNTAVRPRARARARSQLRSGAQARCRPRPSAARLQSTSVSRVEFQLLSTIAASPAVVTGSPQARRRARAAKPAASHHRQARARASGQAPPT